MKKLIAILLVSIVMLSTGRLEAETPRPAWVQNPPRNTANMVYFLGMSDRAANYVNFLEAKAGALADALFQFSAYKGLEAEYILEEYIDDSGELMAAESILLLTSVNESLTLYQQAEWMDRDGTLYVLYNYAPGGRINPRPDLSDAFERVTFSNDRIYFTALAVSPQNNAELARQAEQNARMQALLWLGADIYMEFEEELYSEDSGYYETLFYGGVGGVSRVNLPALSFREESRRIIRGQDNRFYFYGIYSISNAIPSYTSEFEFFEYFIGYENSSDSSEYFEKYIDFNGITSEHNTPYAPRPVTGVVQPGVPESVRNLLINSPDNVLLGLSSAENTSIETQRLMAGTRAIIEISQVINSTVSSTIYDDDNLTEIVIISSTFLSGLEKTLDVLAQDNTTWQVWTMGH